MPVDGVGSGSYALSGKQMQSLLTGNEKAFLKQSFTEKIKDLFRSLRGQTTQKQELAELYVSLVNSYYEEVGKTATERVNEPKRIRIQDSHFESPLFAGKYETFVRLKAALPTYIAEEMSVNVSTDGYVDYIYDGHVIYSEELSDMLLDIQDEEGNSFASNLDVKVKEFVNEKHEEFTDWLREANNDPEAEWKQTGTIAADDIVPAVHFFLLKHPEGMAFQELIRELNETESIYANTDSSMIRWVVPNDPGDDISEDQKAAYEQLKNHKLYLVTAIRECELIEQEAKQKEAELSLQGKPFSSLHLHPEASNGLKNLKT
ncbi:hypothetical protein D5018_05120 [Parashewanella curva]|uniref:Uncharacterized protein n=1 Tax=Parashewanella curva TaxID=2338552 RepID=A0A3L8Q0A1_9GAMM|nr:hypothetical protein [Parashewanella curva]RLV60850.1 hypothetical protein D5018_05120 [Parashewanella curva]